MKFVRICIVGGFKCWVDRVDNLPVIFKEAPEGEEYRITVIEMTKEEYEALPEFTGP